MIITTVTKHLDVEGIIVIGSDKVSDEAFYAAKDIVLKLTSKHPRIRGELKGYECYLVAPGESVASYLELDESGPMYYAYGCSLPPTNNFLGRCASVIEWDSEPNMGVFTHQFAYAIMYVIPRFDPNFLNLLNQAYGRAQELGTWGNEQISFSAQKYWAEGVRLWCHDIREGGRFETKETFREHDSKLTEILDEWLFVGAMPYEY